MVLDFLSFDLLVIIGILIILIGLSFKLGKKLTAALIFALYPAVLIFHNMPFIESGDSGSDGFLFLGLYVVLTILFWKNVHVKTLHSIGRKVLDYSLLSVSALVAFISVSLNSATSIQNIYSFDGLVTSYIDKIPYGVALIIPIIIIFITNKGDL